MAKNIRLTLISILHHLVLFAGSLLLLSAVVFLLAQLAPGDPLQSFYGDALSSMSEAEIQTARVRLGLDESLPVQYLIWLSNALKGDFGISLQYKMPVLSVIRPLLGNTLLLGVTAYLVLFLLASLLAFLCVLFDGKWVTRFLARAGSILSFLPEFWIAMLLILFFAIRLSWFPASGAYCDGMKRNIADRIHHMILPVLVLLLRHLWPDTEIIRVRLKEEFHKEYARLAYAKGCSRARVLFFHCMKNTVPTILSRMAISLSHITGGTLVVEAVFRYPGIGNLAVDSAKYHDYNLLMVLVLITGAVVLAGNLLSELCRLHLDPRIRQNAHSSDLPQHQANKSGDCSEVPRDCPNISGNCSEIPRDCPEVYE